MQLEVKKNKEALAKLKTENKELRSTLSSIMSDQSRNSVSNNSEVNKLEKIMADQRRSHDAVKHQLEMKQKQVDTCQDKLLDLERDISKLRDDGKTLSLSLLVPSSPSLKLSLSSFWVIFIRCLHIRRVIEVP